MGKIRGTDRLPLVQRTLPADPSQGPPVHYTQRTGFCQIFPFQQNNLPNRIRLCRGAFFRQDSAKQETDFPGKGKICSFSPLPSGEKFVKLIPTIHFNRRRNTWQRRSKFTAMSPSAP